MKKILMVFLLALLLFSQLVPVSAAEIQLPNLIGDHMLLQQGKPIRLWGTAEPGATVQIRLRSGSDVILRGQAKAEADGSFQAELPAVTAGGPYQLVFSTSSSSVTVEDVLVGELWVQSGQSNMAKLTGHTGSYANDILPSQTMDQIRLFINTADTQSSAREKDLKGKWVTASRSAVQNYSAVGYSALDRLYQELDMPVGGICCAIGGAGMSSYQGPSAAGEPGAGRYNTKVAPLTRLSVRGVMWYQGEGDRYNKTFASDFKKLITSWRTDWQDSDMPFLFVALPPSPMKYYASWTGSYIMEDFSTARLGQLEVYHELDNVGIAVSMDCPPDIGAGFDALHPNNKKPVGQRLALSALGLVYGLEDKWSSPLYQKAEAAGNQATITFSHAYEGLKTTDGKAPRCFMAAGADGVFYEASAVISGENTVTITCPAVAQIKQISYAVEKHMYPYDESKLNTEEDTAVIDTYADVNLVNSEGLPLCPFSCQVTEVRPEKVPLYQAEAVEQVVPQGDPYGLPEEVSLTKADGSAVQQKALWSLSGISTEEEAVYTLYGLAEDADVIIPVRIEVKGDTPLAGTASIVKQDNKAVFSVPLGQVEVDRTLYLFAGFYDSQGKFLSACSFPRQITKGQTGQLTGSAEIPAGTSEVKLMALNGNLKPFLPVAELNIE
ncbi:MAG: sialate O-acetylesterase [Clostridia bacterium]|nr:sialate O-acetylesterase [Clostridia bacterium]